MPSISFLQAWIFAYFPVKVTFLRFEARSGSGGTKTLQLCLFINPVIVDPCLPITTPTLSFGTNKESWDSSGLGTGGIRIPLPPPGSKFGFELAIALFLRISIISCSAFFAISIFDPITVIVRTAGLSISASGGIWIFAPVLILILRMFEPFFPITKPAFSFGIWTSNDAVKDCALFGSTT